ncbi:MAG TPA: LLM class flavin-dependent oxidoreductase [Candidatus Tectomicrobia bacterium]|nr:LLM class flavin-dependent oxidoreductase [Candidatus Tectomicrobia bacterium]
MAASAPRLGLVCLPRSVASAVADARLAEEVGFSLVGIADSQSVFRELYVTTALCAQATGRVRIGPSVTNPVTRHPAVAASALATLEEVAPGRTFFGIGSGDSAILNLGERPATLADLQAYVEAVRALLTRGEAAWRGRTARLTWASGAVPVYLSAEGPRTLELAGAIADGVIVNVGLEPALVRDAVARVHAGARRAGRDPSTIDLWTLVRASVTDDVAAGIDEIRMELASNAHHVFRFTLEGKHVPGALADAIRRVQQGYQPAAHEALGPSPNARLLEAEPALRAYLADRFAVIGPPAACAERLQAVVEAGIPGLLVTGFVAERARLIRALGEQVLPALKAR